ncbi:hypothetical protein IFM89_015298 [Coptis chinensis]|uniref:HSF-type DNA-binding domain-containing protein n=1 Tax=Coptis chinensis TaxID=261450 RepID=A0A835INE7_9MAGN|nr:hypothetical protein IFM89_015298 [Coptis chinensis]
MTRFTCLVESTTWDVLDDESFVKYKNGLIAKKLEKDPSAMKPDHLFVDKRPIFSFVCAPKCSRFDVSSSANPGAIVPATPAVNGFRKVDPEKWEFVNEDFIKDQKHLLKNIHRRKPIHSHSHPQGSEDLERAALDDEIDKLSREKTSIQTNLWRVKQQKSKTKVQLEELEHKDVLDDESFVKYKNGLIAKEKEKTLSPMKLIIFLWTRGPIFSSGMCTEVFQFDVSSSANPGAIVPATPAVNGFRKVDPEKWEFANEDFIKDQKHLLKNIHRRKPIHSHSHPQGSEDSERAALDDEIDKLSREKTSIQTNLWRVKQQKSKTKVQLEELEHKVQERE